MPSKKILEEHYAKAVSDGMNDFIERKRMRSPYLYTQKFTAKASAIINENNKRSVAQKKGASENPIKSNSSKK